jgi:hypothetical protein
MPGAPPVSEGGAPLRFDEPAGSGELPDPQLPEDKGWSGTGRHEYDQTVDRMESTVDNLQRHVDGLAKEVRDADAGRPQGVAKSRHQLDREAALADARATLRDMRGQAEQARGRGDVMRDRGYRGAEADAHAAQVAYHRQRAAMWESFAKASDDPASCRRHAARERAQAEQLERQGPPRSTPPQTRSGNRQAQPRREARPAGRGQPANPPLDTTTPVNRGTTRGRGKGSSALPESRHGQVGAGGGGGGKGGLPRKRMLGEPRKRRTSGGGGGGFTLFESLINLRIGGGGIHLASGNQVGPKQIGGRTRRPAPQRRTRRA